MTVTLEKQKREISAQLSRLTVARFSDDRLQAVLDVLKTFSDRLGEVGGTADPTVVSIVDAS
jgi:hypothetical protein